MGTHSQLSMISESEHGVEHEHRVRLYNLGPWSIALVCMPVVSGSSLCRFEEETSVDYWNNDHISSFQNTPLCLIIMQCIQVLIKSYSMTIKVEHYQPNLYVYFDDQHQIPSEQALRA